MVTIIVLLLLFSAIDDWVEAKRIENSISDDFDDDSDDYEEDDYEGDEDL